MRLSILLVVSWTGEINIDLPSFPPDHLISRDGVHCRESAGTGPEVPKKVPVTGAAFSGLTTGQSMCASLFARPLLVFSEHVDVSVSYTKYLRLSTPKQKHYTYNGLVSCDNARLGCCCG